VISKKGKNMESGFKPSEDEKLLSLFETYPNQWKRISEFFPGKIPSLLKERFFALRHYLYHESMAALGST
jgi:hypothetical protein